MTLSLISTGRNCERFLQTSYARALRLLQMADEFPNLEHLRLGWPPNSVTGPMQWKGRT